MIENSECERFIKTVGEYQPDPTEKIGIGTYKEKTVHAVLKRYFEPDEAFHEVRIGRYIADIKNENGITEIQTSGFGTMRGKLEFFLESYPVTVVYPIAAVKFISWVDPETGEISDRKKSPKKGRALYILPELGCIMNLIENPGLSFKCMLLSLTEYRFLDGWGNGGKRGSHRQDRIPHELIDIVDISSTEDIRALLPKSLPEIFTSKEFAKLCGFSHKSTRDIAISLKVLIKTGIIEKTGKKANAILYKKTKGATDERTVEQ